MPTVTEFQKSPPNPSVVAAEAAAKAITDAQQPTPTTQPTPAAESSPKPTESTPPSAPSEKATSADWRAQLDTVDEKELRKHPRFAGILGNQWEREREKALKAERAKWEAERAQAEDQRRQQADEAERRRLWQTDPYKAGQVEMQRAQQADAAEVERQRIVKSETAWFESLDLPEEEVARFRGKQYPGSFEDGLRAFRKEATEALAKHRAETEAEKRIAQREKEIRASERAAVLAELNGGEPAPDVNGGTGGEKTPTLEEIANMDPRVYAKLGKTQDDRLRALKLIR